MRYPKELVTKIRYLRSLGKTYGEITAKIKVKLPKSTFSSMIQGVELPSNYAERIRNLNTTNLTRGRKIAREINAIKKEEFFEKIKNINLPVAAKVSDKDVAKIALAMLCLGEASKYNPKGNKSFYLGSSDPRIVVLFLKMLEQCFAFDLEKVRATVQCRADQNTDDLKKYWQMVTGIPERLFYDPLIDPRTIGKPTLKKDYRGVLRIDYFDTKTHLELESLADLIYNKVK